MFDLAQIVRLKRFLLPRRLLMKRFIVSILCVTVFCVGLGAIVDKVGARFKSDEKALALIKQARIAIGGDPAIAEVRSMVIKGSTTHTFKIGSETRTETGDTEIALQLPDKLSKMVKIGKHEGAAGGQRAVDERHDVIIMRGDGKGEGIGAGAAKGTGEWTTADGKKIVVRKVEGGDGHAEIEKEIVGGKNGEFITSDGKKVIVRTVNADDKNGEFTSTDGKKVIVRNHTGPEVEKVIVHAGDKSGHMKMAGAMRQNELLRTTLSLLMTAPEGMDVTYTFAGEGEVDGAGCNIVDASFGGQTFKLYLSKATSLPVMVSYQDIPRVIRFKTKAPEGADVSKDVVMFNHKIDAPQSTEFQIRFSDYRGAGGVQLPYKWTTTSGGATTEVFDVSGYEINPANIADKFQNQKVMVRTTKDSK
jgi:hypothetical protein